MARIEVMTPARRPEPEWLHRAVLRHDGHEHTERSEAIAAMGFHDGCMSA
jgi:hypothetical protein